MNGPSGVFRRLVLAGLVIVVTGLVLAVTSGLASAATGVKGKIGATVFANNYFKGQSRISALRQFDSYWGSNSDGPRTPGVNVTKVYFKEGQWPTGANNPQPLGDLAAAHVKMLISFKPSRTLKRSERKNLANAINLLKSLKANFEVTLWQEPNGLKNGTKFFPSAAAYKAYVDYYGPTVTSAGVPLVYDPIAFSGSPTSSVVTYFPGKTYTEPSGTRVTLISKVVGDYYADQWMNGHFLDGQTSRGGGTGHGRGGLEAVADKNGLPFGLWEFGLSDNGKEVPTHKQFAHYVSYIKTLFTNRLASGKRNTAIVWYDGHGGSNDDIASSTDWKLASLIPLYDALQG